MPKAPIHPLFGTFDTAHHGGIHKTAVGQAAPVDWREGLNVLATAPAPIGISLRQWTVIQADARTSRTLGEQWADNAFALGLREVD